jgi:hypothetical protein
MRSKCGWMSWGSELLLLELSCRRLVRLGMEQWVRTRRLPGSLRRLECCCHGWSRWGLTAAC